MTRNSVVMTCAFNYGADQMTPFFHSLRQHFDGDIVVFSDLPDEIFSKLTLVYKLRILRDLPRNFGPVIDRFGWARDFLARENHFESVFFSDLRDVLFQQSPFIFPLSSPLEIFLEPLSIGNCPMNRRWLVEIYGQEVVGALLKKEICCAGTTRGNSVAMHSYFSLMATELHGLSATMNYWHEKEKRPLWGWDQAVHNFLSYSGQFADCSFQRSGEGLVSSLHYERHFCFDRMGRLLNKDGSVCPVVHQYDRTMELFGGAYRRTILGPQRPAT